MFVLNSHKSNLIFIVIFSVFVVHFYSIRIYAGTKKITIHINENEVKYSKQKGYDFVSLTEPGFIKDTLKVGEPMMPIKTIRVLLPSGTYVTNIKIVSTKEKLLGGEYYIYPIQYPVVVGSQNEKKFVKPKKEIYMSNENYPGLQPAFQSANYFREYLIAEILIYPLQYNPGQRKLTLITEISFEIEYSITSKYQSTPRLRINEKKQNEIKERLKHLIVNPEDVTSTTDPPQNRKVNTQALTITSTPSAIEGQDVEYIIITNNALTSSFQRLADWKNKKGIVTAIKTVSWIIENYSGCDTQEKIRHFIQDAYIKWGTEYILLGGDVDIIPGRINSGQKADRVPIITDLYYSAIDPISDNWNANGNDKFGEEPQTYPIIILDDNADYIADIWVGRVPAHNSSDVTVFIDKVFTYERNSLAPSTLPATDYLTKFLSLGGIIYDLYDESYTPDLFIADWWYSGIWAKERINSNFIPTSFTHLKMYESHWDFDAHFGTNFTRDEVLNSTNAISKINAGYGIVNHIDHSNQYVMGMGARTNGGLFTINDVDNLENGNQYFIFISGGCSPGAFDYDCIGEHLVLKNNGGAVAFIGGSRSNYNTYAADFDYYFYQSLFVSNISKLGQTLENTGLLQANPMEKNLMNLIGDPEMSIWTAIPTDLTVSHPTEIQNGTNNFTVSISNLPNGQDALVCIQKGVEDYAVQTVTGTGGTVNAYFLFTPDTPGELTVTVTSHNFIPYEATVPVYQTDVAHLYVESYTIDDDQAGESTGNGDGIIDAGETIELPITLRNSGDYFSSVRGVTATLEAFERGTNPPQSVPHPYITITDGGSSFGYEIPGQSSASSDNDFGFSVATNCPDKAKEVVEFRLTITDETDATWSETFFVQIDTPGVQHTHHTVNGTLLADATVGLTVQLSNFGASVAKGITATLAPATGSSVVSVTGSPQTFGDINPNSSCTSNYSFTISSDYTYGNEQLLTFLLTIQDAYGKEWTHSFDLKKPGMSSDLQFTGYETAIGLNWSKPGDSDLKGYNIYRSTDLNGTYEKVNNLLSEGTSYYKDTELQEETIYYYKISAVDLSANEIESYLIEPFKTWTTIKYVNGWPIDPAKDGGTNFYSSPKLVDVDGDGDMEIFAANYHESGTIYAWDHSGMELFDIDGNATTISGFASVPGADFWSTPAIADLDGDGIYELLIASRSSSNNNIYCWHINDGNSDGSPDLYWNVNLGSTSLGSPVVGNIDGEGNQEIIIMTEDGKVHVLTSSGSFYQTQDPWKTTGDATAYSTPALADVDKDGFLDIIVSGGDGKIHVWSHDGSNMLEISTGFVNLSASPVIADIDGDGDYEIIIVAYTIGSDCKVFVKDKYGNDKSGWTDGKSISLPGGVVSSSPAIGNLDSDPQLEIVFATGSQVLAWNHDGTTLNNGWPKDKTIYESSPMIADIDDIPGPEIIIGSADKNLYAWHTNGDEVNGWPLRTGDIFLSSPAIGDVDGDGRSEVVVASYDKLVHIWDTKGTTNKDWPMFHFDAKNTGCYSNIVSGILTQNTTWMGKVSVVGNLTVPSGLTLTISSGTTVSFEKGSSLIVNGTLTANDAPSVNKVYFDFKQIDWTTQNGLKILSGGVANITNVVIKNAKYGVYNYEGITNITNSEILDCFYGIYLYRNNYASQQSQIINNIIHNNCPGIHMYSSSPHIRENVIYDNYYGVYCWSNSSPYLGEDEIPGNNNIYDNYLGFYATDNSNPFLGRNTCVFFAGSNKIEDSQSYNMYAYWYCEIYAEHNWWGADPPNTNKILATYYSNIYYDSWLQTPPFGQSKSFSSSPEEVAYNNNFPQDGKEGNNINNSTQNADNGALTGYNSKWPISWKLLYARNLIGVKKFRAAQSVCKEVILDHPDSTLSSYALDLLWQASRQYDKDSLINFLEYLSNKNEKKKMLVSAELILDGYDKKNKELRFDKILKKYNDEPVIEYVLLNKFLYYYHELNDEVNARSILAQIDKLYPDSRSAIAIHDLIGDNKNKAKKSGNAFAVTEKSDENITPNNYELFGNYPNPFNPSTTINYALPVQSNVEINIFDIMGRLIRTFELNGQSAGYQNVLWNGRNENNEQVASGIYLYRFKAVSTDGKVFEKTSKLLMLK